MEKNDKKRVDAYMTIEASFIIPLSFLLILLAVQWGLFCYEKSISIQCCYLSALRGSNAWNLTGTALEQYVDKTLEELWNEKQLSQRKYQKNIHAGITGVEVSVEDSRRILFSEIRGDEITGWDMESSKKAIRNKPSSYLRRYQFIKE